MESYEEMLKKARSQLPQLIQGSDRFQIEKVRGHIEGSKTVLVNIKKIAKDLGRNEQHLLKFLLHELATPGKFVRDRVLLGAKVSASKINKKIKKYVSEYVFCSECSKPETSLLKEKGGTYIKCQACGVKKPVKNL